VGDPLRSDNTLPEVREWPPGAYAVAGGHDIPSAEHEDEGEGDQDVLGTLRQRARRSVEAYYRRRIADIGGIAAEREQSVQRGHALVLWPSGRRDALPSPSLWPPPLPLLVYGACRRGPTW